jgi:transposase
MSRKPRGTEVLEKAKARLSEAKTVDQLRQAQAVVFPLQFGFTLAQTAEAIGVSVGWTCRLRTHFIREGGVIPTGKQSRGGRRRENLSPEDEIALLEPFFEKAKTGGILVVGEIKRALEERLGRCVALASVYNLLHRNGWRKLAPDKRHPQRDAAAQEEWEKTPSPSRPNQPGVAGGNADLFDVSRRGPLRTNLRHPAMLVSQT